MDGIKVTVIGGGSTYTPELVERFLTGDIPVRELTLMDIDPWRLEIVGGLAHRMAKTAARALPITLTTDRRAALDGADFVITQLRVGGMEARILDERIPARHELVGQETTGPGGFAKALRTVPVILDIDRDMGELCPDAWLINFTNPAGLITEALRLYGRRKSVGLCNYPLTLAMKTAKAFDVDASRVRLAYFGLNHLSWTRVFIDEVDRTDVLIERMLAEPELHELSGYAFTPDRLRALGLIPSGYLRYYYDTAKMIFEQSGVPRTRGERVKEVEEHLLACYADEALCWVPADLSERGGAWYSTAATRLIRDLTREEGGMHILNVPNEGAICTLPPGVIVEVPAHVARGTITALPSVTFADDHPRVAGYPVPAEVETLMARVKAYELRAVAAAVTGDRQAAAEALALHPLLDGRHQVIPLLLEEILTAHRAYLPAFFAQAGVSREHRNATAYVPDVGRMEIGDIGCHASGVSGGSTTRDDLASESRHKCRG